MSRLTSLKTTVGALALIAAVAGATAACGREGSLERPGPMFGLSRNDPQDQAGQSADGARSAESTSRNTTGASSAKREDNATTSGDRSGVHSNDQPSDAPVTSRDIRDPAQRLTPLSTSPIQGVPDPLGPPVSTQPPG